MSNPVNDDDGDVAEGLTPPARELEAALKRLRPVPAFGATTEGSDAASHSGLADRDRLMFKAGEAAGTEKEHAAGRRQLLAWRGAAAALAAITFAYFVRIAVEHREPVRVVYVHDGFPVTQVGVEMPGSREFQNQAASRDLSPGPRNQVAIGASGIAPTAEWIGVRGDYLTTRAAVLRWGVAALPRVDESNTLHAMGLKSPTLLDGSAEPEYQTGRASKGSTPTPFDRVKSFFWHKSDGGRL